MFLLSKDSGCEMPADVVYASSNLSAALPKYKSPKTESNRVTF
mgnify:CR=1 FL=1